MGGCVSLRAGLDFVVKKELSDPAGKQIQVFHLEASHSIKRIQTSGLVRQQPEHAAWNCRVTTDDGLIEILSWNLAGGTEEKTGTTSSQDSLCPRRDSKI
jgi:hypothetical protein